MYSSQESYILRLKLSLILALFLVISIFILSFRIPLQRSDLYLKDIQAIETVIISAPKTSENELSSIPAEPMIPVYTEQEDIIDPFKLDPLVEFFHWDDYKSRNIESNELPGDIGNIQPRPLLEVIPEYPAQLRRKIFAGSITLEIWVHNTGRIDSAQVLQNTTQSKQLEQHAIQAALQSRYSPVKNGNVYTQLVINYEFSSP
jgi:TonB family protein